jgi:hypothetical protein
VKDDVIRAIKQFFQSGSMPAGVNETAIVLLPKKKMILKCCGTSGVSLFATLFIKSFLNAWLTG